METRLEIEDSDVDVLKPLYLWIHPDSLEWMSP
jgi:hypothetical protein